jgi:hypothetical protein
MDIFLCACVMLRYLLCCCYTHNNCGFANFADFNANCLSPQNPSVASSAERVHTFPNKPATLIKGKTLLRFSHVFFSRPIFVLNVRVMQLFRSFTLQCFLMEFCSISISLKSTAKHLQFNISFTQQMNS